MKYQSQYLLAPYRTDYLLQDNQKGPLIICLHGYGQSAEDFFKLIEPAIPQNATLLIPNGPYPLPGKARTIESLGFAWYFYDSKSKEYYVPYKIPANLIKDLINSLDLAYRKKIIIGYSQGGYLAPFLAQELNMVEKVICLNSSFRPDLMKKTESEFLVHAINGEDDDMVNPIEAKKKHEGLAKLGRCGEFNLIKDTNHRINKDMLVKLKAYLT